MVDLLFYNIDESYIGFRGNRAVLATLAEGFKFQPNGFQYSPKFRQGYWDGWISLIDRKENHFLKGLLPRVLQFCDENSITYDVDPDIFYNVTDYDLNDDQVYNLYKEIKGPFKPHESQVDAVRECINQGRNIILAPTANGKSYMLHALNAFYQKSKKRILLIIDRSQLVLQLRDNFVEEYNASYSVSTIYDDKIDLKTDVLVTTWQSIYKNPQKWFKNFDVIIADEVHRFKATSLVTLLSKCGHIYHRHGFTGTLDNDSKVDALTLTGMFGEPIRVATTRELIEAGIIAKPTVYAVLLNYPQIERAKLKGIDPDKKFKIESDLIESYGPRNEFIKSLDAKLKGNTLIAFRTVEHGKTLVEALGKEVFYSDGSVKKEKRHLMSQLIDKMTDATGVVSLGTFSTGINIKNINNLIIACLVKSQITVPQLIGRALRVSDVKSTVNIFDLGDNLSSPRGKNLSYKHFEARIEMYLKEGFEIKFMEINL